MSSASVSQLWNSAVIPIHSVKGTRGMVMKILNGGAKAERFGANGRYHQ